jgi:hypothetical protein
MNDYGAGELDRADSPFPIKRVELLDPEMIQGQIGYSMVSFQHRRWFPSSQEHPVVTFQFDTASYQQCVLYQDTESPTQSVSLLRSEHDLLVDSGSTITNFGTSLVLTDYITPSKNGIVRRSVTGQIVMTRGEGRLAFDINTGTGSLSDIQSSIFSPVATCD